MSNAQLRQEVFARTRTHKKKNTPKLSVFAAYAGVFILIISIIAVGYRQPQSIEAASVSQTTAQAAPAPSIDKPSVDEIMATDVAANLAEQTNMPIAANVANLSVSLAAKSELAQTSEVAISKPQIIQPTAASREITSYVTKPGDTVQSIATSYGLSTDTVRWANSLIADSVDANKTLTIPPVDGVVYTMKAGDSTDSLASTYKADKDRIVSFNDLEISGVTAGRKIVIPGGVLPENQRPGFQAPAGPVRNSGIGGGTGYRVNSGIASASVGNKYAWGNCTWYAYERRLQMGRPVGSFWGNANTWGIYARSAGFTVNRTPAQGAVLVDTVGYFGHVAVVESVSPNGDIIISEMNNYAYGGFGVVDRRTISAGQAAAYTYIH